MHPPGDPFHGVRAPPRYSMQMDENSLPDSIYTIDQPVDVQQQQSVSHNTPEDPAIDARRQEYLKLRSNLLLCRIIFWISALVLGIITAIVLIVLSFTGTI